MTIQTGQKLPDLPIAVIDDGEKQNTTTGELFAGRRVVMFAVPGAFTPTCSERHLPGYVALFDAFRERDIEIFCLSVNDAFVMQAWAKAQFVPPGLKMLADGNADFTRALGLELDDAAVQDITRIIKERADAQPMSLDEVDALLREAAVAV